MSVMLLKTYTGESMRASTRRSFGPCEVQGPGVSLQNGTNVMDVIIGASGTPRHDHPATGSLQAVHLGILPHLRAPGSKIPHSRSPPHCGGGRSCALDVKHRARSTEGSYGHRHGSHSQRLYGSNTTTATATATTPHSPTLHSHSGSRKWTITAGSRFAETTIYS